MSETFWNEFIALYKKNPCIWDKHCADYTNEPKRNIAYGLLVEKLREVNDGAGMETIYKELDLLKAKYENEKARISEIEKTGKKAVPVWEHYSALKFLDYDEEKPPQPENTDEDVIFVSEDRTKVRDDARAPYTKRARGKIEPHVPPKRRTIDVDTEDDCSRFASSMEVRMREFHPRQKCMALKLMSDIMLLAEKEQLQLNTSIVNTVDGENSSLSTVKTNQS